MGAELDVMDIYEALNSARLMRALEMSGKLRAKLLDLHELCGTAGLVNILRVDRPISGSVVRPRLRLLLLCVCLAFAKSAAERSSTSACAKKSFAFCA